MLSHLSLPTPTPKQSTWYWNHRLKLGGTRGSEENMGLTDECLPDNLQDREEQRVDCWFWIPWRTLLNVIMEMHPSWLRNLLSSFVRHTILMPVDLLKDWNSWDQQKERIRTSVLGMNGLLCTVGQWFFILNLHWNHLEGLLKHRRVPYLVGLGWNLKICILSNIPDTAEAAGPWTTLLHGCQSFQSLILFQLKGN